MERKLETLPERTVEYEKHPFHGSVSAFALALIVAPRSTGLEGSAPVIMASLLDESLMRTLVNWLRPTTSWTASRAWRSPEAYLVASTFLRVLWVFLTKSQRKKAVG